MANSWTFDGSEQSATAIVRANPDVALSYAGLAVNEDGPRMWLGKQIIAPSDKVVRDDGGVRVVKA